MTVNFSRGMSTSTFFRLCSRALWMRMAPRAERARREARACGDATRSLSLLGRGRARVGRGVNAGSSSQSRLAAAGRTTPRTRAAPRRCESVACAATSVGRAGAHHLAAGVAALGPEIDDPVGGADHVEVVLDHHQRMAGGDQLAEGAQQLGDVVEVQAGGGLVEQEQRGVRESSGARSGVPRAAGCLREMAGELQALRLAAGQRGHGLAELQVLEADVRQRLQRAQHLGLVARRTRPPPTPSSPARRRSICRRPSLCPAP